MRPEALDDANRIDGNFRHGWLPCLRSVAGVEVLPPQRTLRQSEERATTPWADLLVVATIRQLVPEPEFPLNLDEVVNHRHRRVGLPAPAAQRLPVARAGVLIEADA